jgi:hypothetical protein
MSDRILVAASRSAYSGNVFRYTLEAAFVKKKCSAVYSAHRLINKK